MNFDIKLEADNFIIYASNGLSSFINKNIDYFDRKINFIKQKLNVSTNNKVIIKLTDNENEANFVYEKSDFSGFFNETGCFAYINLYGNKSKDYILKGIIHELVHHFYKYYVYGEKKNRIVWVDEGLATFLSGQKDNFIGDYKKFIYKNLEKVDDNFNLNNLNHKDKSFSNNNGYNLSYLAIKYLYENNSKDDFIRIIKDEDMLLNFGICIIKEIKKEGENNVIAT